MGQIRDECTQQGWALEELGEMSKGRKIRRISPPHSDGRHNEQERLIFGFLAGGETADLEVSWHRGTPQLSSILDWDVPL